MKKTALKILFTICLLFCAVNVTATTIPVKVISNYSHVWGNSSVTDTIITNTNDIIIFNVKDSYDSLRSGSISFNAEGGSVRAESQANLFNIMVDTYASSSSSYSCAFAQTDTIFSPLNNFNTVDLTYSIGGEYWYYFEGYLIDLTNNKVIWNTAAMTHQAYLNNLDSFYSTIEYWGNGLYDQGTITINYNFQSDHEYSLHLYARSDANYDGSNASFGFNIKSVPEPVTVLLFGFGLMGVAGLRRIFKKR